MPWPHLYARPTYLETLDPDERMRYILRSLALRHQWVFTHESAALMHHLFVPWNRCETPHVASSFHRCVGGIWHHVGNYQQWETRDGVHVTPLAQTMFDCLRSIPFIDALGIADSALAQLNMSREQAAKLIKDAWPKYHGINQALATLSYADPRSENGGESFVRAAIISLGYAAPELQAVFPDPLDPRTTIRADGVWTLPDGTKVGLEVDGFQKYEKERYREGRSLTRVLTDERQRESRITLCVDQVMRIRPDQARNEAYLRHLLELYRIPKA